MQHVGFIRKDNIFPGPLLSIGQEDNSYFVVYPTGIKTKLSDVDSIETLKSKKTFISSTSSKFPRVAYAFNNKDVYSGDVVSLVNELSLLLLGSNHYNVNIKEETLNYLCALQDHFNIHSLNSRKLFLSLNNGMLNIELTKRKIRKSSKQGQRLIVQWTTKNKTTTLFKKNLPTIKKSDIKVLGYITDQPISVVKHKLGTNSQFTFLDKLVA